MTTAPPFVLRTRTAEEAEPDLTSIVVIHRAIRQDLQRLAACLGQIAASGAPRSRSHAIWRYTAALLARIRAHHQNEDEILWPVIAATAGQAVDLAPLTDDHQAIRAAADRASRALASFSAARGTVAELHTSVRQLRDMLDEHIADEEQQILAAMRRYLPADSYRWCEQQMRLPGLRFTAPWLARHAQPEELNRLLAAGHSASGGRAHGMPYPKTHSHIHDEEEPAMIQHHPEKLMTRLGSLAWRSSGQGPAIVFFAGALANGDLWRDVVTALEDRYRCITIDLPLGAHPWPLSAGADRSATSLARQMLDCLDLLQVDDATVVANDTAGGLLLLSLASGHPALGRVGRLVLTNCDCYDQFPPDSLKKASAAARAVPWLARAALRLQARSPVMQRRALSTVTARGLDSSRMESFFEPIRRDKRVADDLVAAMAGFRTELTTEAAAAIPQFDRPALVIWGEACRFFPMTLARRLASEFPRATLIPVPGAGTWVPVDDAAAVADAIGMFAPASAP